MGKSFLLGAALLILGGCGSVPTPQQRQLLANQLAETQAWRRLDIEAPPFVLAAWLPGPSRLGDGGAGRPLTVYLEGDGLAWLSRSRTSGDPTPTDPVGLRLSLQHSQGPVAYLARPCQYISSESNPVCEQKYWTTHRFAPEVMAATSHAIDVLKKEVGAPAIRLAGYSGGGAIAALVAASRNDVQELVTIAGNLDHALWTERHFVDPLSGSLNPADVAGQLSHLPQLHFVGSEDGVMPKMIAESFVRRQGEGGCAEVVEVAGASHRDGWVDAWPTLLQRPFPCSESRGSGSFSTDKP